MTLTLRTGLVIPCLLALGCASSAPATRPTPEAPPEKPEAAAPAPAPAKPAPMSVASAAARELEALPVKEVPFPDAEFSAQVESSGDPKVTPQEGFIHVEVPISTRTPLSCFVYPKHLDTGAALMGFIHTVTEKVQVAQIRPMEIAAVGIDPVVIVHVTYVVASGETKQQGLLKVGVRAARGNSLLCYHDEPGYSKAFSRMVQTFARTLQPKVSQTAEARFGELQVVSFRDVPVGFERRRYLNGKNGGRVDEIIGMMLMPRSATDLISDDSSKVTVTDKTGYVESIRMSEANGGEPSVDFTIKRTRKNEYAYEGELSGKPVKGSFKSKDKNGLQGDELVEAFMRTKMFDGKTKTYVFEQYDPELDLNAPMQLTVTPKDPAERKISLTIGAMTMEGIVDENGLMETANMTMGPATLNSKRVASTGSP